MKVKDLVDLIYEVVIPFYRYISSIEEVKTHLKEENKKKLKHALALLSVALVKKPELVEEMVLKAVNAHQKLKIDYEIIEESIKKYFKFLVMFLKKRGLKEESKEILKKYENMCMQRHQAEEEDFFDFDRDFELDEIDKMHFEDDKKISAKDFMQEDLFDIDMIEELRENVEEIQYLIEKSNLDEEYIRDVLKIIESFITIFNISHEFRDLGYNLEKFKSVLTQKVLEYENKELLKALIDSVLEDLLKWYYSVIEHQEAVDIHYLDASLLANIAQIEIILKEVDGN